MVWYTDLFIYSKGGVSEKIENNCANGVFCSFVIVGFYSRGTSERTSSMLDLALFIS